ncbi:MAG UNVERIFIED_CONTAM: fibronectin type III domain-containing protein [Planctomycetaceae bacterium]
MLAENKIASLRSDWSRGIDITIGDRPVLMAPSGFVNTTTVTVRWLPFPQAVTYQLWISQTTPTLQQVFYQSGISGTFHEVAGLKRGTAYRVWVRAILSSTTSTYWSQPLDFTIV